MDELSSLLKEISVEKAKQYFLNEDICEAALEVLDFPIYGSRMSVMLISSRDLRITLKIQYDQDSSQWIGSSLNKDVKKYADGIINEFCNIIAGSIKGILEKQGFDIGISIPVSVRAFDEIFYERPLGDSVKEVIWGLKTDTARVTCLACIQIFNKSAQDMLKNLPDKLVKEQLGSTAEFF